MSAIQFINPPGLAPPPGYSHLVVVDGGRLLVVAGQVALDQEGRLVGHGDLAAQLEQVFTNLRLALAAGGATFDQVVKLTYFLVDYRPVARDTLVAVRDRFVNRQRPPASTLLGVQALARPEFLVEVEALAVIG